MLIGIIRPVETRTLTIEAHSLAEDGARDIETTDRAALDAQAPDGWALIAVRSRRPVVV